MNSDTWQLWPLVVIIEDCYVPHAAPLVIGAVKALSEKDCDAMWACEGWIAQKDAEGRAN